MKANSLLLALSFGAVSLFSSCSNKAEEKKCCSSEQDQNKNKQEITIKSIMETDFYTDGKFDAAKGKQAYYDLMKFHHVPIGGLMKTDEFWVSDFSQGDFKSVGMGGIFWVNNHEQKYFGHDILLLPGQMLAEHKHNAVGEGVSKMESWNVRNGSAYFFSEGEPEGECPVKIPESQLLNGGGKALKWQKLEVGELAHLSKIGSFHFIIAGPEGAIITEYATPHYDGNLEFANTKVVF